MRRIVLCVLFALSCIVPATAETVSLASKVTVSELRSACSTAGGNFSVHPDGGGYGCEKQNCDGKGGSCIVACDNNNNCAGQTPSRVRQSLTLLGLLQDGDMVFRGAAGGDPRSLTDSGPGADVPPEPVAPPPGGPSLL